MARYRKIDVRMWVDQRFGNLSAPPPNGRYLWMYLLTGPETVNVPGIYRAGEAALAEAIGWSLKGFREAFAEVSREGMAKADWSARVIWIPKAILYNEPESPNVVKSWRMPWDEIPECDLKKESYQTLKAFLEGKGEAFLEAFVKACTKPSPNQEQEQEQEQNKTFLSGKPDLRPQAIEILNFLNTKTGHAYKPVDSNLRLITALLKQGFPADDVRAVIAAKCRQWQGDPKMSEYLRPSTLFRASNFANYEGQLPQVDA